jgi:hypothetical protein
MPVNRGIRPFLIVLPLLTAVPAFAADPTKQQCVAADDAAQDLRQEGKLRAAREKLAICTSPACPALVREDCKQRIEEVDHATANATGKSTDPGAEAEVARGATPAASVESAGAPTAGSTQRTVALVLGGAGTAAVVVGVIFGLVAKGTYDQTSPGCRDGVSPCSDLDRQHSSDAHSQAGTATGAFVAGGALLATSLALYLTAPKTTVSVAAAVAATGAGVRLEARW